MNHEAIITLFSGALLGLIIGGAVRSYEAAKERRMLRRQIDQARWDSYHEGYLVGHAEGYSDGRTDGYAEGHHNGYASGVKADKALATGRLYVND